MISDGLTSLTRYPLLAVYPGVVLMILVVGINMLGEGIGALISKRTD